jgi:hypothetical protein
MTKVMTKKSARSTSFVYMEKGGRREREIYESPIQSEECEW